MKGKTPQPLDIGRAQGGLEADYRTIFDAADDGIIIQDLLTGDILDANQRAYEMSRHVLEDLIRGDFPYAQDEVLRWIERTEETGPQYLEWIGRDRPDREFRAQVSLKRVMMGGLDRLVTVIREVTEPQGLAVGPGQTQRMEALGQLAGGIVQDFNNLITSVISQSERVLHLLDGQDPMYKEIEKILKTGEAAASLTKHLLAFTHQQMLQPEILDINRVILEMEEILKRLVGKDIQLVTSLGGQVTRIRANRGQLEQVIINLAANVRDTMNGHGELVVKTEDMMVDEKDGNANPHHRPGRHVCLSVESTRTGTGRAGGPKALRSALPFTPDQSPQKEEHSLSIAYSLLNHNQGWLTAHPVPPQGTVLKAYLPAHSQEKEEPTRGSLASRAGQQPRAQELTQNDRQGLSDFVKRTPAL